MAVGTTTTASADPLKSSQFATSEEVPDSPENVISGLSLKSGSRRFKSKGRAGQTKGNTNQLLRDALRRGDEDFGENFTDGSDFLGDSKSSMSIGTGRKSRAGLSSLAFVFDDPSDNKSEKTPPESLEQTPRSLELGEMDGRGTSSRSSLKKLGKILGSKSVSLSSQGEEQESDTTGLVQESEESFQALLKSRDRKELSDITEESTFPEPSQEEHQITPVVAIEAPEESKQTPSSVEAAQESTSLSVTSAVSPSASPDHLFTVPTHPSRTSSSSSSSGSSSWKSRRPPPQKWAEEVERTKGRLRPGTRTEDAFIPPTLDFDNDFRISSHPQVPPVTSFSSSFQIEEYITALIREDFTNLDKIVGLPYPEMERKDNEEEPTVWEENENQEESLVSEDCWIYEHLRRICLDLTLWVISLQKECMRETCPEMKAGDWLYLCAAHVPGTETECSAIDYTHHTLDGTIALLNSSRYFPSRLEIPKRSLKHFTSVARRLYRIFAHAYFHHRDAFEVCEAETLLYARFLALIAQFDLIDSDLLIIPL